MHGIAQLYGRYDQHGEGDEHVADLLRRTVDGQFSATESFEAHVGKLLAAHQSPFSSSLQVMAVLQSQWLAALWWEMATAYLDAVVIASKDQDRLPQQLYRFGDTLCDEASVLARTAIELQTKLETGSKVRLSQLATLPPWNIDAGSYHGIWAMFDVIVSNVETDYSRFLAAGLVPSRMRQLFDESLKQLQQATTVFARLRRDMDTTRIAENKIDFAKQAVEIVHDVFRLGQQLWAPYLIGQPFTEAFNRKPSLDELELGVDPWVLTDPRQKKALQSDRSSQEVLAEFWSSVENINAITALVKQLHSLLSDDAIRRRSGRSYQQVPWQSQFLVRRPVSLGNRNFEPGDLIAFYVLPTGDKKCEVQVRKTGKLTRRADLLGQPT